MHTNSPRHNHHSVSNHNDGSIFDSGPGASMPMMGPRRGFPRRRRNGARIAVSIVGAVISLCVAVGVHSGGTSSASVSGYSQPTARQIAQTEQQLEQAMIEERFSGTGSRVLGGFTLAVGSTLQWRCASCVKGGTFEVTSLIDHGLTGFQLAHTGETSGTLTIPAGTYHDVRVISPGQDWSITIVPTGL